MAVVKLSQTRDNKTQHSGVAGSGHPSFLSKAQADRRNDSSFNSRATTINKFIKYPAPEFAKFSSPANISHQVS